MNFEQARQKHAEWRVKLRGAIAKKETLDVGVIAKDTQCDLGKWLHGEAKQRFGRWPAYNDCVAKHAHFHLEAGRVAKVINDRQYDNAHSMLGVGSGFSSASAAIVNALDALEKETLRPSV